MDVVNDQMLDVGLTVLGYGVAGALGMVVYSMFHGRSRAGAGRRAVSSPGTTTITPRPDNRSKVEFVDLSQCRSSTPRGEGSTPALRVSPGNTSGRDRTEIIRLVREMLKAGTPRETIKRTLPISDGEIALLQNAGRE